MRQLFKAVFLSALLATTAPLVAQTAASPPVPIADLVKAVDIPYEAFTLANGLRVIVHTDRKAPIVAVSIWYHIGSKDEPAGKTGFAHLFEHLMFYGSENNDTPWFKTLDSLGATQLNGTTSFDRTNYFQNVPTPALERNLFLESDRMGYLLGAVTQAKLDAQRGVVQNEKRQGDNAPLGLAQYATQQALFPDSHPYSHRPIGSMADLDAASLEDVRGWFRANYGPNNAVLVLAGDIDLATARPMVERHFGQIPAGPAVERFPAPVPAWTETRRETLTDKIPTPILTRYWNIPGQLDTQASLIDIALTTLAGGQSSRLYNALVREDKLAVSVGGGAAAYEKVGWGSISVTLAPGADPAAVEARIDAALADFLENGPTADELSRIAMRAVSGTIRSLEAVGGFGGKAVTLAEGALYAGDPAFYKKDLAVYASATPQNVRDAARTWLARGEYRQTVMPGDRPDAEQSTAEQSTAAETPASAASAAATSTARRPPAPPVAGLPVLKAPELERTRLANGIEVALARRDAVPVVRIIASFDGGSAADSAAMPGIASLALGLLDEGAAGLTGPAIAEMKERLGAGIGASRGIDRTTLSLDALGPNLAASLELFAKITQAPDFPPAEIERVRGQALTGIAQQLSSPGSIASRMLPALLYSDNHPYGRPASGTPEGLNAITREALQSWHQSWIRPDSARLFVVGDIDMATLKPLLEASFGTWQPPAAARGEATLPPAAPAKAARIILIDRPGSPQSFIRGGVLLPRTGKDDDLALGVANDILGGIANSRLNVNIREEKNWAYSVGSGVSDGLGQSAFQLVAPVQSDRTGDALKAIIGEAKALSTGARPLTTEEREEAINGTIRGLPGSLESGSALLGTLAKNEAMGRPDNYYANLTPRLTDLSLAEINKAAKLLDPSAFTWVVVGDLKTIKPQLETLGLPLEIREAR